MRRRASELLGLTRLVRGVRSFVKEPLSAAECSDRVRRHTADRGERWLRGLEHRVWTRPGNPYRLLLDAAGIEGGDLENMVREEGLDGCLAKLHDAGVWISWEEFKGRAPAIRGSSTFHFQPADFDNPLVKPSLVAHTGASSGKAVRVNVDLEFIERSAPTWGVLFAAHGWRDATLTFWTPTHTGLANRYLLCAKLGYRYRDWFAMADMRAPLDRLRSLVVHRTCQRLLGLSREQPLPLDQAAGLAEHLAQRDPNVTHLINTSPSAAVRLAEETQAMGRRLDHVTFLFGAEPLTRRRRTVVTDAGATSCATYGTSESGWIGAQFPEDHEHDQVRVFRDTYAVVPGHRQGSATEHKASHSVLVTSLIGAAPKVLINVELGDQARFLSTLDDEPARTYGYTQALHTIRSFRKVTCFGVTIAVADLYPILEQGLPERFGGGAGDYQLIERQLANGESSLELRIAPSIGELSDDAVTAALLEEIGRKQHFYGQMTQMMKDAAAIRIERSSPLLSPAGKTLPVVPGAGPPS